MFSEYLAQTDLLLWPMIGMGVFFVTFVVAVARVLSRRPSAFDGVASLPLDSEEERRVVREVGVHE
jgi:hypothetical protein